MPGQLVQSVRSVALIGGYPYWAYGLYRATVAKRGGYLYWRLINSGRPFRSDVHGRTAFPDAPIVSGIRHGSLVS